MKTLQAKVVNGRIVVDAPTQFPEGTVIDLTFADAGDDMDDQERAALYEVLTRAWASVRAGECAPAEELIAELQAKR